MEPERQPRRAPLIQGVDLTWVSANAKRIKATAAPLRVMPWRSP